MNKLLTPLLATLLCATLVNAEEKISGYNLDQPNSTRLNAEDPTKDSWKDMRDFSKDNRPAGPINVQRQKKGWAYQGIPTFFHQPIALTPEDLKVGKVDVAIMGASLDMSVGRRGAAYGPLAVRGLTAEYYPWGVPMINTHSGLDPFSVLSIVDYGDAPIDPMSTERSINPIRDMVTEIAKTGTIPFIVGGDHSLMYVNGSGLADVHGKGSFGVVHFDAHPDAEEVFNGHYLSHGAPVRRLIEEGHVKGENYIQIGIRSNTTRELIEWSYKQKIQYHYMGEIHKRGWAAVEKDVLAEAKKLDKIYISVDLDALEPSYAPGMGTPEPDGMTPRELLPIIRKLCTQNNVIGFDVVELNPLVDVSEMSALMANRVMRSCLAGLALRKKGITDPNYEDPMYIKHY